MTMIDWTKLGAVLNEAVSAASIDTNVSMSHDGMTLSAAYSFAQSPAPATWQIAPDGEGLTIAYSHESSDDSRDVMHIRSENGTFNYAMNGTLSGDITALTLKLAAQASLSISMSPGPSDGGEVVNASLTMPYAIESLPHGDYRVTPGTPIFSQNDQPVGFEQFTAMGLHLTDQSEELPGFVAQVLGGCENLADPIQAVLNGSPS